MTFSRRARAFACAGAFACGSLAIACDPKEAPPADRAGPPFLVLGLASVQPASVDAGVELYVQSRGGNYLAIDTHGCTHSFGPYSGQTYSCGQTAYYSSVPLYLVADPEGAPCRVEARLYSICDCIDAAIPYDYADGGPVFMWCDQTGTLVATQVEDIGPPGAFGSDGGAAEGGEGGAGEDAHLAIDSGDP
jgi:hypothetical protein